jgi:hypothetical protein
MSDVANSATASYIKSKLTEASGPRSRPAASTAHRPDLRQSFWGDDHPATAAAANRIMAVPAHMQHPAAHRGSTALLSSGTLTATRAFRLFFIDHWSR